MRIRMIILMITLITLLSACMNDRDRAIVSMNTNSTPTLEATEEPDAETEDPIMNKQDNSTRAIADDQYGRLIIQPKSHAIKEILDAPSCWGLETDLRWTGDYEARWEPATGESSIQLMTFPEDFEIIQPTEEAVNLQMITIGDTDLYIYYPRYTDCHALDLYLFGVKDGEAFPVSLEVEEGQHLVSFVQHPHFPLQVTGNELVITGGQGAGQDFVHVYHFNYDPAQHAFFLKKTDNVTPEDLMKQTVDSSTEGAQ